MRSKLAKLWTSKVCKFETLKKAKKFKMAKNGPKSEFNIFFSSSPICKLKIIFCNLLFFYCGCLLHKLLYEHLFTSKRIQPSKQVAVVAEVVVVVVVVVVLEVVVVEVVVVVVVFRNLSYLKFLASMYVYSKISQLETSKVLEGSFCLIPKYFVNLNPKNRTIR